MSDFSGCWLMYFLSLLNNGVRVLTLVSKPIRSVMRLDLSFITVILNQNGYGRSSTKKDDPSSPLVSGTMSA